MQKKYYQTIILYCMFIVAAVSCQKKTTAPLTDQEPAFNQQEELVMEPVTPLDKNIPLPMGRTRSVSLNSSGQPIIPIVLVHGLIGWGPDEFPGYSNWGGTDDLAQYLTQSGYPTYIGVVGSLSSNYDRAVELYYYIKGGYVDYGQFHSSRYGHAQKKTRYYPGIYPQWDAAHPIHLVGHSQGGVTIRKLITLLERGSASEQAEPEHASLFDGGKANWVKTVTTISTPHNGTTLTSVLLDGYIPFVRELLTGVVALSGTGLGTENIFSFKLDQWGLQRRPGESFQVYTNRVASSEIWTTEDYSGFDLTPESMLATNLAEPDSKELYYFSFSTKASNRGLLTGWEYPRLDVFPLFIPIAFPVPVLQGIGNFTRNEPGKVVIDSKWWPNDGAANVYGMSGPANSVVKAYNPAVPLEKGVWNHMGVYNGYDHLDIIGIDYFPRVRPFYLNMAQVLAAVE